MTAAQARNVKVEPVVKVFSGAFGDQYRAHARTLTTRQSELLTLAVTANVRRIYARRSEPSVSRRMPGRISVTIATAPSVGLRGYGGGALLCRADEKRIATVYNNECGGVLRKRGVSSVSVMK